MRSIERIKWIDFAKGFGIICVIMAHIGTFGSEIIFLFQMPYFFMLSGYMFSNSKLNESLFSFVKNSAKRLIWPYFVFGMIGFIFWGIVEGFSLEFAFVHFTSLTYANIIFENDYVGAIWFLSALFSTQILFFVIEKFLKYDYLIVPIITIIGLMFNGEDCILLPLHFEVGCVAIGFYYIGYIIKEKFLINAYKNNRKSIMAVYLLVGGVIIGLYNQGIYAGKINMLRHIYGNPFLFFVSATCISSGVIILFQSQRKLMEREIIVTYIGKHSLFFMAIHMLVLKVLYMICNIMPSFRRGGFLLISDIIICYLMNELVIRYVPFLTKWPFSNKKLSKW